MSPDDPILTSYLLGELTPEEDAAVEQVAAEDPAIRAVLLELSETGTLLSQALSAATTSPALDLSRKEQIRQEARSAAAPSGWEPTATKSRRPLPVWAIPTAAAAALVLGILIFSRVSRPDVTPAPVAGPPPESEDAMSLDIALLPAPGPPDSVRVNLSPNLTRKAAKRDALIESSGDKFASEITAILAKNPLPAPSDLPAAIPRNGVLASEFPSISLPVQSGTASLAWISSAVRIDGKLPSRNAVRLEEVLNSFPIRANGPTAIAKGVSLSTETLPCPWRPSATLLLVSLRGASEESHEIETAFEAGPNIYRYRLLGFDLIDGLPGGALPRKLPAGALTTLAIEIEPRGTGQKLGQIRWSVDRQSAASVDVVRKAESEPSNDARFASLICAYAQWLKGDQSGIIDSELVAALTREAAASTLPAERSDLLTLIQESLDLK